MPSAAELRRLAPAPLRVTPKVSHTMSVGPPVARRQEGPLVLRREDDLTQTPKGRPDGSPGAPEAPRVSSEPQASRQAASPQRAAAPVPTSTSGIPLPPGIGRGNQARGADASRGPVPPGALAASIDRSVARRLERGGPLGLPMGTGGKQLGSFFFDPQGADFTTWLNHGKNELYRNWIIPQSVMLGYTGAVTYEFTVERDGRMSSIALLESSGTPALDRAARNSLTGASWLPLPDDFRPSQLTFRITFLYGNAPKGL